MDGIKIEVTGNIARVIERPSRITAGTIGLPVEFTFDSHWEGFTKTAVFTAGHRVFSEDNISEATTVPWEVLQIPGPWLTIGVFGESQDCEETIPTIWVNISPILPGASLSGEPSDPSAAPVWNKLRNEIADIKEQVESGYISDTNINEDGELEITFLDGTVKNVGKVVGTASVVSPTILDASVE